jgi:hypothetical protein
VRDPVPGVNKFGGVGLELLNSVECAQLIDFYTGVNASKGTIPEYWVRFGSSGLLRS